MRNASIRCSVIFLACSVLLNVMLFSALRVVFYMIFQVPADPVPSAVLLKSLFIGFKFDLRLALLMNAPVFVFSLLRPLNIFVSAFGRRLWTAYLLVVNFFVLFVYAIDIGHYGYVQSRLNITAVRFLYNLSTSLQMIWDSYPVVWSLLGLGGFLVVLWFFIRRAVSWISGFEGPGTQSRLRTAAAFFLVLLLIAAGIYGKLSWYPLRWSDAFFSPYQFASAVASNPVLYFLDTVKKKLSPYDLEKTREYYPLMADYLGVDRPDLGLLSFTRFVSPKKPRKRKLNVVIVFLESFAFYKTGVFGNPLRPSPDFDEIAGNGALFTRFYVPSVGTARSVFTAVTGIPDVETHKTASRNPLIVNQHTIVNAFEGYEKFYFLGGSLNWANIRGFLSSNIPGLRIFEEGSYTSPRVDMWGISDLHLFEEATKVFRALKKPFFAFIQTSGNHRPYHIPEDNRGFPKVETTVEEVTKNGFESVKEYNAFRFMDHSIGFFIRTASRERFFRDTVFVFFGDHGIGGNAGHMPKVEEQLYLTRFHVPLVIFAPGIVPPAVYDAPVSEVDILPTVAALAAVPYVNSTLGRDLFAPRFESKRYAFTVSNQAAVPEIGLVGRDHYFLMLADGSRKSLHEYGSGTPRDDVTGRYPVIAEQMETLTRAIFETSRYMPYFNSREKVRGK
jgi:phosphoglycerol transferase MdoB-like AlkP superfamily enzyme